MEKGTILKNSLRKKNSCAFFIRCRCQHKYHIMHAVVEKIKTSKHMKIIFIDIFILFAHICVIGWFGCAACICNGIDCS